MVINGYFFQHVKATSVGPHFLQPLLFCFSIPKITPLLLR